MTTSMDLHNDQRYQLLTRWLDGLGYHDGDISIASWDASFRRYFRVTVAGHGYIAMDAPPDKEDCRPFMRVAAAFAGVGLNVPRILEADPRQGFLLLNDLGRRTYLTELNDDNHLRLYQDALDALFMLQTGGKDASLLPPYDEQLLMQEMELFRDWLLVEHLGVKLSKKLGQDLQEVFAYLSRSALEQPRVWVHRDYHSRNLMVTDTRNPGVLDFQDAVTGPVTYDLVSLLRDCYIRWPQQQVDTWRDAYFERLSNDGLLPPDTTAQRFRHWFDLMGVQRHLKASGIFARLCHRDGKAGYLDDIPRTLGYVLEVCPHYPQLHGLQRCLQEHVVPHLTTIKS